MELKRATELTICSLLKEALGDLVFYPSRGGGDDITPVWAASHAYKVADILRPTNTALTKAVVVTASGNSGTTEPAFDDVVGSTFIGPPDYETTAETAILTAVDAGTPTPPYGVVSIDDGEKVLAQEETNLLQGTVVWVTKADATNIVQHSKDFKRVYDAMTQIGSGYDIMRRLTIHGVDVQKTDEFTDDTKRAHGDVVSFIIAVTEKLAQS